MSKDNESKSFKNISSFAEMRRYLDSKERLKHTNNLYHYTSVQGISKIIKTKMLYLRRAEDMNDKWEYDNGDHLLWKNLFFSSFMGEEDESIAMWSMYAQPWGKGVKISIPKDEFQNWIKEIPEIYEITDQERGKRGKLIYKGDEDLTLKISAVAYCTTNQNDGGKADIYWSNQKNTNMEAKLVFKELTGYLKYKAWSYEKEIRIKAEFNNKENIRCIAVPLTDELIDSMTVTAGPLFKGDLESILKRQTQMSINTDKSIFTDKLKIHDICKDCSYKIKMNK